MRRSVAWLLLRPAVLSDLAAAFAWTTLGVMAAPALAGPAPAVWLLAPAPGQTLRGGETAVLAWEAAELPPEVEEWEAFLSFDGGATYPYRVTPHLDRKITRFAVRVPNLPTASARLLLRFGDERQEHEVDAGFDFTIALTPGLPVHGFSWHGGAAGEPARDGLPGTVVRTEGARDGSGLRVVVATAALLGVAEDAPTLDAEFRDAVAEEPTPPTSGVRAESRGLPLPRTASPVVPRLLLALAVPDRFALLGRRNE